MFFLYIHAFQSPLDWRRIGRKCICVCACTWKLPFPLLLPRYTPLSVISTTVLVFSPGILTCIHTCIMRSSRTISLMASCLHLPSSPGTAPFPIFTEILVLLFCLCLSSCFCVCICACISLCICIWGSQHIIDGILLTPVLVLQFQFTQRRHCH